MLTYADACAAAVRQAAEELARRERLEKAGIAIESMLTDADGLQATRLRERLGKAGTAPQSFFF